MRAINKRFHVGRRGFPKLKRESNLSQREWIGYMNPIFIIASERMT